ncbi:hypothetical protein PR048_033725 [Dryococelus australis]|uniref:Uncharacterized protein n=1 Tax=Dryococelus australis TaxID=614101 RepID=A0ABQ9G3X4_9NEOP|nr:hypothetical protein PR048_033725 [Dryococelus australis]
MDEIHPTYSYKKEGSQHSPNVAYNFIVDGRHIRVCKNLFMKTWDISTTFLTTVKKMISKETRVIEEELRGNHKNKKKIDETIAQDIRDHIN